MFCRGDVFFFTIVLVVTYPVPLRGQQQRFAAPIEKQINLESTNVLARNKEVICLVSIVTLEKAWR